MAAGIYNFTIEQGVTLNKTFIYADANGDPVDITGYSARMQSRATMQSSATVFERTTTPANGLSIPVGTDGAIVMTMTATETAELPCGGIYDLEIISPTGTVTRLLQGSFSLSYEVTR
jgi:hypothetical protein